MKATIIILLIVICGISAFATEQPSTYMSFNILVDDTTKLFNGNIQTGCYVESGKYCYGVYYIRKDGSSGVYSGLIAHNQNDILYELFYSLTLLYEPDRVRLYGSIYSLHFLSDNKVESGDKVTIEQVITAGEPVVIPAGTLPDGRRVAMSVIAYLKDTELSNEYNLQPLNLITTQFFNGKVLSKSRKSHPMIKNTNKISTSFSYPVDNIAETLMKYKVKIWFSKPVESITSPTPCQLVFTRTYSIDTLHYQKTDFEPDLTYETRYIKDVVLLPNQELKIVIPPDTPTVRQFDMEDTLIIIPGMP